MQWNNDMEKQNMRWSVDKALQLPLYTWLFDKKLLKDLHESCRLLQILIKVYQLTLGILAQLLRSVPCHSLFCSNKCNWGQAHVLPAVPISQVRSALRPLNHGLARYVWSPRSCYAHSAVPTVQFLQHTEELTRIISFPYVLRIRPCKCRCRMMRKYTTNTLCQKNPKGALESWRNCPDPWQLNEVNKN